MWRKKTISLKSCDGFCFKVEEAVALKSKTIAKTIEEIGANKEIHIVQFEWRILELAMEYCEKHIKSDDSLTDEEKEALKDWDTEFIMDMEQSTLIRVIQAANHLQIKDLLDLCCQTVADLIKDKSAEEIRAHFNIEKPLTEEQEEEIRNNFLNSIIFDQALTPKMSEKTITLTSSDGESFEVDTPVALKMQTIANTIEDIGYAAYVDGIPIVGLKGNILKLVIDYCETHVDSDDSLTDEEKERIKELDIEFILKMEKQGTLFDVRMAADYLNIKDLIDFCAQAIADRMKGKTAEEISTFFNIERDLTEEEDEIQRIHGLLKD